VLSCSICHVVDNMKFRPVPDISSTEKKLPAKHSSEVHDSIDDLSVLFRMQVKPFVAATVSESEFDCCLAAKSSSDDRALTRCSQNASECPECEYLLGNSWQSRQHPVTAAVFCNWGKWSYLLPQ